MSEYYTDAQKRRELEKAVDKNIDSRITNVYNSINAIKEKSKEKKVGFIESIFDKISLRIYRKTAAKLNYLSKAFCNLESTLAKSSYSQITFKMKEAMENVIRQLSTEDRHNLSMAFNRCLHKQNSSSRAEIAENLRKVKKSLKKTRLEGKAIFYCNMTVSLSKAAERIAAYANSSLQEKDSDVKINFYRSDDIQISMAIEDHQFRELEILSDFSKEFRQDKEVQKVLGSAKMLREKMATRKKAESINSSIEALLSVLSNPSNLESSMDFEDVIKTLKRIQDTNNKTIQECSAYISQFDFEYLKKITEEKRREKEAQDRKNSALKEISSLAYDIAKAKEEGKSAAEIAQLEKKLKDLSYLSASMGVSQEEFQTAIFNGNENFRNGRMVALHEERQRQIDLEEQTQMASQKAAVLRDIAIKQLEEEGSFDKYEWRNGDAYSSIDTETREKMIRERMQKLSLSVSSSLALNHVENDLSQQDIAISPVQTNLKSKANLPQSIKEPAEIKEQQRQKANTIYAQYLKYLASLENKNVALKFSEYARFVYSQNDIDLSMVDEEVKGRKL